jgi:hypothetical protein
MAITTVDYIYISPEAHRHTWKIGMSIGESSLRVAGLIVTPECLRWQMI